MLAELGVVASLLMDFGRVLAETDAETVLSPTDVADTA